MTNIYLVHRLIENLSGEEEEGEGDFPHIGQIRFSNRSDKNIVEKMKLAKDSENTVEGYISKDTNFRSNKSRESFLFDTGATVCIIDLDVAKDNNLKISKLKSQRNII